MNSIEKLSAAITMVEEARSVPLSASCVIHRSELLEQDRHGPGHVWGRQAGARQHAMVHPVVEELGPRR